MSQSDVRVPDAEKLVGASASNLSPDHADREDAHGHALDWRDLNRVLCVAASATAMWFRSGSTNPYITALGVICTLAGGFPIFHEAYRKHHTAPNDDGDLHGYCHCRCSGDP